MSFINTVYNGHAFTVPATGRDHNLNSALTEVPDEDHAMAYLLQDGNLAVPGGRYGTDTRDCARLAWLLALIVQDANGDPMTYWALDSDMSSVVNGADDVLITLIRNGHALGDDFNVRDWLDEDQLREGIEIIRAQYDDDTASADAASVGIVLLWRVVDIPIVETAERPRRVLFEGTREQAEGFYFEFIERDDVDPFYVELELSPTE